MPKAVSSPAGEPLFRRDDLMRLIIPLVIEQLLLMTVGMADTVMVTTSGEAAVSGVSLVDNINTLILQVFSARFTVIAPVGHFLEQSPQRIQVSISISTWPLVRSGYSRGCSG